MNTEIFPYRIYKKAYQENIRYTLMRKEEEINSACDFIRGIQKGNLDEAYKGEPGLLASSLLDMRSWMKEIEKQEKERKWVTDGLAAFVEVLRSNNNNVEALAAEIIKTLVKYLGANQGGLFVVGEGENQTPVLELKATYAFDRQKHLVKKVEIGEGLLGQCFLEKETLYLSDIPNNYIRITSGLGGSNPTALLLVPLKINEKVFGVIELASFYQIKSYEIMFVEKLAENVASTLSNSLANSKTQTLLHETQKQAEALRSQEEELKQNMEELNSTQEEMARVIREVQSKELYLKNIIDASQDFICTINKELQLVSYNKALERACAGNAIKLTEGISVLKLFAGKETKTGNYYEKALKGEMIEVLDTFGNDQYPLYYAVSYGPLRNENNEIIGAYSFSRNITDQTLMQNNTETLLAESLKKEEAFRSREDNLCQIIEEMKSAQELLELKINETDSIKKSERERADNMINAQKELMESYVERKNKRIEELMEKLRYYESLGPGKLFNN
jgi:GAF domain-containing protein